MTEKGAKAADPPPPPSQVTKNITLYGKTYLVFGYEILLRIINKLLVKGCQEKKQQAYAM